MTRGAQGILRLAQDFTPESLEQAAGRALALGVFSYRAVRDLLLQASAASGAQRPMPADTTEAAATADTPDANSAGHENVRGAKYFH